VRRLLPIRPQRQDHPALCPRRSARRHRQAMHSQGKARSSRGASEFPDRGGAPASVYDPP